MTLFVRRKGRALVAVCLVASNARAGLVFEPMISGELGFDTNPTMRRAEKLDSPFTAATAALPLRWARPLGEFVVDPRVTRTRYGKEGLRDADNENLALSSSHALPKASIAGGLSWSSRSTALTEFEDTGLLDPDTHRINRSVELSGVKSVGRRTQVALSGARSEVRYDEQRGGRLFDYDFSRLDVRTSVQLGTRTAVHFRAGGAYLDSIELRSETDTRELAFGWERRIASRWSLDMEVGKARNDNRRLVIFQVFPLLIETQNEVRTASIGASMDSPRGSLGLTVARAQQPTGRGELSRQDRLAVSWTGRLSDQLRISLEGSAGRLRSPGAGASSVWERDYRSYAFGLIRRLGERASMNVRLRHRWQSGGEVGSPIPEVDGTSVQLSFDFRRKAGSA